MANQSALSTFSVYTNCGYPKGFINDQISRKETFTSGTSYRDADEIGCNVKFRRNLLDARSKLYRNLKQMKTKLEFLKLPPHAILTNGDVA